MDPTLEKSRAHCRSCVRRNGTNDERGWGGRSGLARRAGDARRVERIERGSQGATSRKILGAPRHQVVKPF